MLYKRWEAKRELINKFKPYDIKNIEYIIQKNLKVRKNPSYLKNLRTQRNLKVQKNRINLKGDMVYVTYKQ